MIMYTKYLTVGQIPIADTQYIVEAGITIIIHNLIIFFNNEILPKFKHYHLSSIFRSIELNKISLSK